MNLYEMVRNIRIVDQSHTDAILTVGAAVDRLTQRIEDMATNLQQALAAIRAEAEDERSTFIASVKIIQALSQQVNGAADAIASGAEAQQVAQDLNDIAIQMRENAGPLAAAIVANTPQAVPPMAPSPAGVPGSGDGVSATLPSDAGAGTNTSSGTSPSSVVAGGTPTTSPDTPPTDGQTRVDPNDASKLQVSADGRWYSEGDTRTQDGKMFQLQGGSWVEQGGDATRARR